MDIEEFSSTCLRLVDGFGGTKFETSTVENFLNGIGIVSVLAKKEGCMEVEAEYIATRTILKLIAFLKESKGGSMAEARAGGNFKINLAEFTGMFAEEDRPESTGNWKEFLVYAKNPKAAARDYNSFLQIFKSSVSLSVRKNIDAINAELKSL
jgi:hypothetical protein